MTEKIYAYFCGDKNLLLNGPAKQLDLVEVIKKFPNADYFLTKLGDKLFKESGLLIKHLNQSHGPAKWVMAKRPDE